jgi:hypothetical protein
MITTTLAETPIVAGLLAASIPEPLSKPAPASIEALGQEIARLAARLHAGTHALLVLLREFDERTG